MEGSEDVKETKRRKKGRREALREIGKMEGS